MSSTFCQSSLARLPRKRSRAPAAYQASAPSASKASPMRLLTASSCNTVTEPSPLSLTNTAIGTPQARWREITQSGRFSIMPLMRFSPCGGTHLVSSIAVERAMAQRVTGLEIAVVAEDVAVHRDEPLRRVAEDHRLLRTPRMRVLMLQPPARDQHAVVAQHLDHSLVCVTLLALVGEDALAGEARCLIGERAVFVDRVGDRCIDAALFKFARICSPYIEVLAPVSGCGVHEAGTSIVGHMITGEQRNDEIVALPRSACAQTRPASNAVSISRSKSLAGNEHSREMGG